MILGVGKNTSTPAVLGDSGRFPLLLRHHTQAVKYWLRIRKMDPTTLPRQMYELLLKKDSLGYNPWITKLKNMLLFYDMLWLFESSLTDYNIHQVFKDNIYKQYETKWYNTINDYNKYPKLRFYKTIKSKLSVEPYLTGIRDYSSRNAISKLRLSAHRLNIEVGRHRKIPLLERTCEHCPNEIEDEFHFIMVCKEHSTERNILIQHARQYINDFEDLTHEEQFHAIMSNEDCSFQYKLSNYIKMCFMNRL